MEISDEELKMKLPEEGNTLTRIEATSIGTSNETTEQEAPECCSKPTEKENIHAVSKDKISQRKF